ncbi:helix-turn-helix domain-containing protein [Arthrobacter koreensis]|uniref:Helix-turn-helix domain-containing protein n=1 Tax=Arthrobacter koreensis TaxID=199136 RepID=A0ABY6FS12_9MICC|nr:helix-turn-helix domain-containing protein [Arthrobacter koreensis]UYB35519.1 helix-turn-helix domain-containing protein [Arthrobacter koreensis]
MTEKKAYTVQEAAAAYGVSADVIRAHIKAGNLAARYPTSRPILGAIELQEWFEALPSEPK